MSRQSFVDEFCENMRAKYQFRRVKPGPEDIGLDLSKVITAEALINKRLLGEKFAPMEPLYPELQGFHHACNPERLIVGFDKYDSAWNQLGTKLHELAEYIVNRLSVAWPEFGLPLRHTPALEKEALADKIAHKALSELMSTCAEVSKNFLILYLGLSLSNFAFGAVNKTMLRNSQNIPQELMEMPERFKMVLLAFYHQITDYMLLQETENLLSAEEARNESCPVCQSIIGKASGA